VIDLHCHILPGLDDGPGSFDESLAMARMAAADGVCVIVATPHMDEQYRYPEPEMIRELVGRLNDLIRAEALPLRVLPGAEVRTGAELVDQLVAGKIMTLGDQNRYVLVELPSSGHALYAGELFFRLQLAGYTPLIAHIERVELFRAEPRLLHDFKDRGYGLQVNAESVSGRAGRHMHHHVMRLVKEGLADVLASDGHDVSKRRPLLTVARKALRGRDGLFEQLTNDTPRNMLTV
jgi:protein-tyrosine phosphatase